MAKSKFFKVNRLSRDVRTLFVLPGVLLLSFLAGCGNPEIEVSLTRKDLQQKIAPGFPIEKKVLIADVKLHSPEIYLTADKVGLKLSVDAILLKFPLSGKVDVQGVLTYNPSSGQFFVTDVAVVAVEVGNSAVNNSDKLKQIIAPLIVAHLQNTPVYTLPDDTLKQQLVGKLLKKVVVRDGVLIATFGK